LQPTPGQNPLFARSAVKTNKSFQRKKSWRSPAANTLAQFPLPEIQQYILPPPATPESG
jgi:hypothetical protein